MSHQVLARKWRPRDFASLVGQEHVVRALGHALTTGRVHHAYLFTGTRGVGKTTIARILAKSLNCETGMTAQPCGRCGACTEIDAGRFPDYLELDAASNRGVEEMVQLLENAVYAPTIGRRKVYVIDEVHMLSSHAFNAMLKTLEEPPDHVVFILATTDPQKVPVTVLSRCLQFNLRNMAPALVAEHLAEVLTKEAVPFEAAALPMLGRAAGGSMRDALSLLDQAIAYGGGQVMADAVREMLGDVDRQWLVRLLDALVAGDGPGLIGLADEMRAANAPFGRTLSELASLLHRVALAQHGVGPTEDDAAALAQWAQSLPPEDLQVYYQIAVHGARDLPWAPDEATGFSMVLLRLLAFRPRDTVAGAPGAPGAPGVAAGAGAVPSARPASAATAAGRPASPRAAAAPVPPVVAPTPTPVPPSASSAVAAAPVAVVPAGASARAFDGDWAGLAARVSVSGLARQFMEQSELLSHDGLSFEARVPIKVLSEASVIGKVRDALSAWFGAPVRLQVTLGSVGSGTAAAQASQQRAERLTKARAELESDPFVQTLLTDFGGRILPESVRPNES